LLPNLLKRNFEAKKPNQKWVTDVTEFSLFGQKLYLSPILDLCSRDIVSYSISDRPVLSVVTQMLDKAFAMIPDGTNSSYIPTKAGSTNISSTRECSKPRVFGKV
jgi:transposase InsO family protein